MKKKADGKYEIWSVRLAKDLVEKLKRIGEKEERSMSYLLNKAAEEFVQRKEGK